MIGHDLVDDGQTQSRAPALGGEVGAENPLPVVERHAGAGVRDLDPQPAVPLRQAGGYPHRALAIHRRHGVDIDWDEIFGQGVRWFHSGGIYAALSEMQELERPRVIECLREISALLPAGVDLTSFVYKKTKEVSLRGETDPGRVNLIRYMSRLLRNKC